MERIRLAVSDSGPLIHLSQIGSFDVLRAIKRIYIPLEVFQEVCIPNLPGSDEVRKSKIIEKVDLNTGSKNFQKVISTEYSVGLGEAAAISLAKQENVKLFLTDDLAARMVAKQLGLEPRGTVGIVLKAYREGIIGEERSLKVIQDLQRKSSLFLTSDLVRYVIREIRRFKP